MFKDKTFRNASSCETLSPSFALASSQVVHLIEQVRRLNENAGVRNPYDSHTIRSKSRLETGEQW